MQPLYTTTGGFSSLLSLSPLGREDKLTVPYAIYSDVVPFGIFDQHPVPFLVHKGKFSFILPARKLIVMQQVWAKASPIITAQSLCSSKLEDYITSLPQSRNNSTLIQLLNINIMLYVLAKMVAKTSFFSRTLSDINVEHLKLQPGF